MPTRASDMLSSISLASVTSLIGADSSTAGYYSKTASTLDNESRYYLGESPSTGATASSSMDKTEATIIARTSSAGRLRESEGQHFQLRDPPAAPTLAAAAAVGSEHTRDLPQSTTPATATQSRQKQKQARPKRNRAAKKLSRRQTEAAAAATATAAATGEVGAVVTQHDAMQIATVTEAKTKETTLRIGEDDDMHHQPQPRGLCLPLARGASAPAADDGDEAYSFTALSPTTAIELVSRSAAIHGGIDTKTLSASNSGISAGSTKATNTVNDGSQSSSNLNLPFLEASFCFSSKPAFPLGNTSACWSSTMSTAAARSTVTGQSRPLSSSCYEWSPSGTSPRGVYHLAAAIAAPTPPPPAMAAATQESRDRFFRRHYRDEELATVAAASAAIQSPTGASRPFPLGSPRSITGCFATQCGQSSEPIAIPGVVEATGASVRRAYPAATTTNGVPSDLSPKPVPAVNCGHDSGDQAISAWHDDTTGCPHGGDSGSRFHSSSSSSMMSPLAHNCPHYGPPPLGAEANQPTQVPVFRVSLAAALGIAKDRPVVTPVDANQPHAGATSSTLNNCYFNPSTVIGPSCMLPLAASMSQPSALTSSGASIDRAIMLPAAASAASVKRLHLQRPQMPGWEKRDSASSSGGSSHEGAFFPAKYPVHCSGPFMMSRDFFPTQRSMPPADEFYATTASTTPAAAATSDCGLALHRMLSATSQEMFKAGLHESTAAMVYEE